MYVTMPMWEGLLQLHLWNLLQKYARKLRNLSILSKNGKQSNSSECFYLKVDFQLLEPRQEIVVATNHASELVKQVPEKQIQNYPILILSK